ncbi:hypothetical protein LJC42_08735 [Eubacteriales bacterium OttesenSCG-928-K08]|nr:hypothetical protein [Eubacteriales bacterium OttesenSCG-928-K08]
MKNHEWRDGKLLQTNKKWSQLKMSQRAWILETTRAEHVAYVEQHGALPMKKKKEVVLDAVYEKINERGIWIPYGEFKREANKCIDRQNRKSSLRIPSQKEY